jgi:hypothetical protein
MAPAEIVELSLLQQFFRLDVAGLVTKNKHRIFAGWEKTKIAASYTFLFIPTGPIPR